MGFRNFRGYLRRELAKGKYFYQIVPSNLVIDIFLKETNIEGRLEYLGASFNESNAVLNRGRNSVENQIEAKSVCLGVKKLSLTVKEFEESYPHYLALALSELRGQFDV